MDLEDILQDDSLFSDFEVEAKLFDVSRYQGTVRAASTSSSRKRMRTGFESYKRLFEQVHSDIASGQRQIKKISEAEISQKSPIKQGNFYIDNGVMLYVAKLYDPETGQEVSESTNRRLKVHTVYENGTENHIWLLSLISSLYDTKRSGRLVSERIDDIRLLGEEEAVYQTTGYIYVVSYAGEDPDLLNIPNLYKIGVASDINQRLSNTQNEATYLYAPVVRKATFEIQNISARKVEKYLHDVFANKRVELTTTSPTGKTISITEWFIAPLDEIKHSINKLISEIQE
ncbi:GIY-YIG nuclease family protein [Streptococcus sp. zg-JUN1979]|uniref:GIY-YIG nuclease family protein n=1 Tax=Streptococcus sp. zg-JUN1979 TaxID=3391450 RepID=UPI0039B018D8